MKVKFLLSLLLSLSLSISTFAQISIGSEYIKLGEYKLAKNILDKEISQNAPDSYYFLGEIAYHEGNLDLAKLNYEKGLAADSENPLNQIGLAKLQLKNNTKEADKILSNIAKKNKKNIFVVLEVAQAYLDEGMEQDALEKATEARKIDKKSPLVYIFEGDVFAKSQKPGEAAAQYEQAFTFDPNSMIAYVKYAKVYEGINPQAATEMLQKAYDAHPEFTILNKYVGDLYYRRAVYSKAIEAYAKYFTGGDYTINDITNYAASKFFTDDYEGAKTLINEGLKLDNNNFVLNRLLMYTQDKQKEYNDALKTAQQFFTLRNGGNDSTYIAQDFAIYANILKETGDLDAAISEYEKAIKLDATQVTIYKSIAATLSGEKKSSEAALVFTKYIDALGESAVATDYFQQGRYYYIASSDLKDSKNEEDIAKKIELVNKGDIAFAKVAELIPDSHLGSFWRGRIQVLADPQSKLGLAKPHYEATISIINSKENHKNNKELIEAYSYLGVYWYIQWNESSNANKAKEAIEAKENTKINVKKILELDPTNKIGIDLKNTLK